MRDIYILDDQNDPVAANDFLSWGLWMDAASKDGRNHVGDDDVGDFRISTIFIGKDMNVTDRLDPILFETIIFHFEEVVFQTRYKSWDSAKDAHDMMVKGLQATDAVSAEIAKEKIAEILAKAMSEKYIDKDPGHNAG